jgi:hypothetical protein
MTFILPGGLGQMMAAYPNTSAWDPTNASAPAPTFSNNNRTLTGYTTGAASSCRGVLSNSTGKHYFEGTIGPVATGQLQSLGVVNTSWTAASNPVGVDSNGVALVASPAGGNYNVTAGATVQYSTSAPPAAGDVLGVAVDFTTGSVSRVYFSLNGIWVAQGTNVATFNAALPDFSWGAVTTLFTAGSTNSASPLTLNTGNAAFKHAPPPGFSAWG